MNKLKWNHEVAQEVYTRLNKLFEGLPEENVRSTLEDLFDDYAQATFGLSVMSHLRDLKVNKEATSQCIQGLAKGRVVLFSNYGFTIKSESFYPDGRAFIVMEENSRKAFEAEMGQSG